jgi:hypothetical protein
MFYIQRFDDTTDSDPLLFGRIVSDESSGCRIRLTRPTMEDLTWMNATDLSCKAATLPGGIQHLMVAGRAGIGSAGNPDGARIGQWIRQVLVEHHPRALVIDLRELEYRFGNWIAAPPLAALKSLGPGCVCVLASGETLVALRSLWNLSKLDRVIPLAEQLPDALAYFSNVGERIDAVRTDVSGEEY